MFKIEQKRALLTGAASGIGRAIAIQLARRQAQLCLVDIQQDALQETAELCKNSGAKIHTITADLNREETIHEIKSQTHEMLGGLDILINNAGIVYYGPTEQMSQVQRDQLLGVNLLAPIHLTAACLPMLLENRQSRILNISSMFGLFPSQGNTIYHSTKYGILGYSLALRAEFARYGLGVSAVCPGFVRTELFNNMLLPEGRNKKTPPKWTTTSSEVIAKKSLRAIERNQRLVTVTALAKIGHALERICPWVFDTIWQLQPKRPHEFAIQAEKKSEHNTNKSTV